MAAEVNGQMAVAKFAKGRAYLYSMTNGYFSCGAHVITPKFVFVSGHAGPSGGHDIIVSIAVPVDDVRIIVDNSIEPCEVCAEMAAETKVQTESDENEESSKD